MEESRKEAAQARIVPAESNYDRGNADQMRTALGKVLEDLRTQVWSYLNDRLIGGNVSVIPEGCALSQRFWVSSEYLLGRIYKVKTRESSFAAWSLADGKVLWQTPQRFWTTFASFCDDSKEICCLTENGI
jgi:hypothetical protein